MEILIIVIAILLAFVCIDAYDRFFDDSSEAKERRGEPIGNLGYIHIEMGKFLRQSDWGLNTFPYEVKFKYYGGTWIFQPTGCKLWWVHSRFQGIDKEKPEYESYWNHWKNNMTSIKYIMEHHPNLVEARRRMKEEDKVPQII